MTNPRNSTAEVWAARDYGEAPDMAAGEIDEIGHTETFAVRVPPLKEILERWKDVFPMLRRATARTQGCYEPEDVLGQCHLGRCTMLFIEHGRSLVAVAVTEVRDYPRRRVLDIGFIGARPGADTGVREWAPILTETLNRMARAVGATMLSGCGRIGWARVAGFKIAGGYVTRMVPNE